MSKIAEKKLRNEELIQRVTNGEKVSDLQVEYKLTRERIRQILEANGITIRAIKAEKLKKQIETALTPGVTSSELKKLTYNRTAVEYCRANIGKTPSEIAKELQKNSCYVMYKSGWKPSDIAKSLKVHRRTVYKILKELGFCETADEKATRNKAIKTLYAEGVKSQKEIAEIYHLTITQVANIIHDRKMSYDPNKYKSYKTRLDQLNNTKHGRV